MRIEAFDVVVQRGTNHAWINKGSEPALLAGILIGPGMLNLIHEGGGTHLLAELGVVFLLFDIGMHVSLRELKESRSDLLGLSRRLSRP